MRLWRRLMGLTVGGLLLAGIVGGSQNAHVTPAALSLLNSGDLVILDPFLGLFQYSPGSGKVAPRGDGFGLYQGVDLQVATLGGAESIFVTQVPRSAAGGARLVRFNPEGREKGDWPLPPGKKRCSGVAIDAQASVAYVVSPQTAEIFKLDLRKPRTSPKPLAKISQEGGLGPMILDSKRRRLLVADVALGVLYAVDIDTGKSVLLVKHVGEPSALALDARTDELFIADSAGRRLWRVGLASKDPAPQVFSKLKELREPTGLTLSGDGTLWVGDIEKGRLFHVSLEGTLVGTVKL
jgi:hypothetical protein